MRMDEYWDGFTSSEKDLFQKSCRRLLKSTFLVRDKDEENKKAYYFVSKRQEVFSLYFGYIGFDVVADRENGVVMLRNCADLGENGRIKINRFVLKKAESVVLCCLWTLYADRIRSGGLSRLVFISVPDLRFELEKYGLRDSIDKSTLSGTLALFTKFNLLDIDGKVGDADCRIRLYPSLQFALEPEEFRRFVSAAAGRMQERTEEATEGEEDDETEE